MCNKHVAEHIEGDSEVIPQSSDVILQVEMSSENESAGALNNSEVMKRTAKFSIDYDVGLKCARCDGSSGF